jgi:hypothetical protein
MTVEKKTLGFGFLKPRFWIFLLKNIPCLRRAGAKINLIKR